MDRPIRVLAYAGSKAEERPRGVWRGEEAVAVTDVLWGWIHWEGGLRPPPKPPPKGGLRGQSPRSERFVVAVSTMQPLTHFPG